MKKLIRRIRCGWAEHRCRKHAVIGEKVSFDVRARCMNLTGRRENIRVGGRSKLSGTLYAYGSGSVVIGECCYISYGTLIGSADAVRIGRCVIISNDVHIYDNNTHSTDPDFRRRMCEEGFPPGLMGWQWARHAPVAIGDNVWIGQYATILKGVTIGEGAVIGCCAVVTHDVPPYAVAAGNPARIVGTLPPKEQVRDAEAGAP